jgi:hypothetical protein
MKISKRCDDIATHGVESGGANVGGVSDADVVDEMSGAQSRPRRGLPHVTTQADHNILRLPSRRVILLGASNLVLSFPSIVATARATWGEPVEIMAAMGHGRSYGKETSVFGRKISGIFPCALWQDLQKRAPMPTAALVTDIGNDLLYGVAPNQLLEWVVQCVDRLIAANASVVLTQLPIENLERLGEARFRLFRRVLFPRNRFSLADIKAMAYSLNDRLIELGESRKVPVNPVSSAWYGFDPIHLTRRGRRAAWPMLLSSWRAAGAPLVVQRASLWSAAYMVSRAPWERSILGIRRRSAQPSGRLSDGSTISLY